MDYRWRMYLIQLGLQAFALLQQSWGKSNKNPDESRRCLSWKCLTWHQVVTAAKEMLLMVYVTDDWYHHHFTPKLLLMEQLSWKRRRLPDSTCSLFQAPPPLFWDWWESTDKTMTSLRWEHQSQFSSSFEQSTIKTLKTLQGIFEVLQKGFQFLRKSEFFLHSSQSTQPAVISSSILSFQRFCLGSNPMIHLWLCGSVKASFLAPQVFWFDKIKVQNIRKYTFKCKMQHVKLLPNRLIYVTASVKYASK